MSIKTALGGCYNEDDFVERKGELHELTVTITLCEYRNLITEQVRLETINERLANENADLEEKCRSLTNALAACKLPEWVKQIGRALCGEEENDEEEVEPTEEHNGTE